MNVRYEHKEALTFIGYHTEIRPEEGYEKCPRFWDREYTQKYARLWQTMTPETPVERAILDNGIGGYALCVDGEEPSPPVNGPCSHRRAPFRRRCRL